MSQFQPPPPPPTYHYGGAAPIQDLSGLSVAVRILLGIMIPVSLVAAWIRFDRSNLIRDYLDGRADARQLFDADDRVAASTAFIALGVVVTGIVFIIWQFKHAKNARALGAVDGLGPGWAIGGWFVPIAGIVLPGVQMFQSSKASHPQRRGARIVVAWAIVFGVAGVGSVAAYADQETDEEGNVILDDVSDVESLADADAAGAVGFVLFAVSAALAIVMVGKLTDAQSVAQPQIQTPGPPGYYQPPATFGVAPPPSFGAGPPPAAPPQPVQSPPPPPVQSQPPSDDIPPPG